MSGRSGPRASTLPLLREWATSLILSALLLVPLLAGCRFPRRVHPTIKIGLVAPFEGRYRYVGYDVIYAVRLALREANGAGGVNGYNIELIAYDDGADPSMAIDQARKLVSDPWLVAVIGHFRDETTAAAIATYAAAGLPLVSPAVLNDDLGAIDAPVFRLGPTAASVAREVHRHLAQQGIHQAALVTDGGALARHLRSISAPPNVDIGATVSALEGDWLNELIASPPTAVFCDSPPVLAGEIASALRDRGWAGSFFGGSELGASDFAAVAGTAAQEAVYVTAWPFPADVPDSASFVTAYREVSGGSSPGPLALPAYEATWALIEALMRESAAPSGRPTRASIARALADTRRHGYLGLITFDANHSWSDAQLHWYQIVNGTPELAR